MKLVHLSCTPDAFLAHLRFATEIDTVEKNQKSAKEAVFYGHTVENTFTLYERPAFTKDGAFLLGDVYLRGAVAEEESGCQIAFEIGRPGVNLRYFVICLLLTLLSVAVTVLSGNVFATMMPILGLIAGGYLIVDVIRAAVRARRLKRKWSAILSGSEETGREEDGHVAV